MREQTDILHQCAHVKSSCAADDQVCSMRRDDLFNPALVASLVFKRGEKMLCSLCGQYYKEKDEVCSSCGATICERWSAGN